MAAKRKPTKKKLDEKVTKLKRLMQILERKGRAVGLSADEYLYGIATGKYPRIDPADLEKGD